MGPKPLNIAFSRLKILGAALITFCIITLAFPQIVNAQDYRAKLTVIVTDQTGASIPNALVTLKRGSTGTITSARTNSAGSYTFQFLEPDTYSVTATARGMITGQASQIVLQAYQATSVSMALKVGPTTTSVTVSANSAILETRSASRAWVLDNQQIQKLPVPNNNPVMLGDLLPGVYMRPLGIFTDPWTITSQYLINGGLMYLNQFEIDGSPNDAQFAINIYGYTPPNFAVKEMTVSANNYDAQYGHTSGGVVNLITKSGTDHYHGMGWVFFRRPGWNANSFQNNAIGAPRSTDSQHQFGGQAGGPIVIPHVIGKSGHTRAYFFTSFDRYRELLPNALSLSYPTQAMRNGDFSGLTNPGGSPITLYDPTTGHYDTSGNWVRDPFPGNIIPTSRINPIAAKVGSYMPLPNQALPGVRTAQNDFAFPNNYFNWHYYSLMGHFDLDVGEKHKFFFRPYTGKFTETSNYSGSTGPGGRGGKFSRFDRGFLVDAVNILSPKTVLSIRYGYAFHREQWLNPPSEGFDLTSLGLPSSFVQSLQQPALFGDWNFEQYSPLGWFQTLNNTGLYSIEGSVVHSAGRHVVHVGWDVWDTHWSVYNPGSFTFNSNSGFTRAVWNDSSSESYSGDSFASFLLGTPSSGNVRINPSGLFYTSWYYAPWIEDDWQISHRLTLNLGLRWDVLTPPVERRNQMNIGFNPDIPNAVQAQIPPSSIVEYPQLSNVTGGVQFADVNGNPRTPFPIVWHNLQPRIGFAWMVTPRLVVRGGYGLFYTNFQSNDMMQTLGFSSTTNSVTSLNGGMTSVPNVFNNPLPNGVSSPLGAAGGTLTYLGQRFLQYNSHYKIPDANEFSLGFQFRATRNGVLDMSYVGNRVVGYSMNEDANLPSWTFAQQCDEIYAKGKNSVCQQQLVNPFQNVPAFNGTSYYSANTVSAFDVNRPHLQFGAVTIEGLNEGQNWYNALQVNYTQRLSHGLAFSASYVWSKQIEQWGWMNQYLNIPQKSVYLFGLPQVFKAFATYQLPFGEGKLINFHGNHLANRILGGWSVDPDFTLQSGEPQNLPANAIPLKNSVVKNVNWNQYHVQGWGKCVLVKDISGIITPASYSLADGCGTNFANYDWLAVPTLEGEQASPSFSSQLRMKPMVISDLAIEKSVQFEHFSVTFKAQATNVLNHYNLLNERFDTNPYDPNFGTLFPAFASTLDAPPRNIELGLTVNF